MEDKREMTFSEIMRRSRIENPIFGIKDIPSFSKKASLKRLRQFTCCVEIEFTFVQIVNQSRRNSSSRRSCVERLHLRSII